MKSLQESVAGAALSNAILSQLAKQQFQPGAGTTVPQVSPVNQPQMPPREEPEQVSPVYRDFNPQETEPESEGLPRFIPDDEQEDDDLSGLPMLGESPEEAEMEVLIPEVLEEVAPVPPVEKKNTEVDTQMEISPETDDVEIVLEEVPEDFLRKETDEESLASETGKEDEGEAGEARESELRKELKSFISDVRSNLDQRYRAQDKNPVKLLDYLANMSNYLPQESRFSHMGNEMRLRVESLRSRLSGRRGLFERIKSSFEFPEEHRAGGNALTSQNLVSTFSFIRELSHYVPDKNLSSIMRNKIERILGKIRRVAGG